MRRIKFKRENAAEIQVLISENQQVVEQMVFLG
jgi:hypothetical protein